MNDSLLSHQPGEWFDFEAEVERIEKMSRAEVAAALVERGVTPRTRLPLRLRLLRLRCLIAYRVSQLSLSLSAAMSSLWVWKGALVRVMVICIFAPILFWVPARIYSAGSNVSPSPRTAVIFMDISDSVDPAAKSSCVLPALKTTLAEVDAIRAVSLDRAGTPLFSDRWDIRDPEVKSSRREQRFEEVANRFQQQALLHLAAHRAFSTTDLDLAPLAKSLSLDDQNVNVLLTDAAFESMAGLASRPQNVGSKLVVVVLPDRNEVKEQPSRSFTRKMDSWRAQFPGSRVIDGLEDLMARQQSSSISNDN